jgi:chromosome segregation ATPase
MEATPSPVDTAQARKQTTKDYKSPPHALIWFFRKSRDLWKSKYQELKASVKQLKNRIADLTKSREQWKLKAEQANDQLGVLEAEIAGLRAQVATLAEKKTTRASNA